jgi:hypothetical protein
VRLVGAAIVVLAVLVPASPMPAQGEGEAATITETGWWTRRPSPSAPAGGFEVANAPDGPLSVAALRILIEPGDLTQAILVLKEASGLGQDAAGIKVCLTTATWTAANGGPLSAAPRGDCNRSIDLKRDATTATWSAELLPLLSGQKGTASIVVVPGPDTVPLPVDPGFQVVVSGSQLLAASTPPSESTSSDSSSGATQSSGSGAIASDTSSGEGFQPASGDFASSYFPPASSTFGSVGGTPSINPSPLGAAATTSDSGQGGTTAALGDPTFQPVAAKAERGKPKPWRRLIWMVPLAILVGGLSTIARKQLRSVGSPLTA